MAVDVGVVLLAQTEVWLAADAVRSCDLWAAALQAELAVSPPLSVAASQFLRRRHPDRVEDVAGFPLAAEISAADVIAAISREDLSLALFYVLNHRRGQILRGMAAHIEGVVIPSGEIDPNYAESAVAAAYFNTLFYCAVSGEAHPNAVGHAAALKMFVDELRVRMTHAFMRSDPLVSDRETISPYVVFFTAWYPGCPAPRVPRPSLPPFAAAFGGGDRNVRGLGLGAVRGDDGGQGQGDGDMGDAVGDGVVVPVPDVILNRGFGGVQGEVPVGVDDGGQGPDARGGAGPSGAPHLALGYEYGRQE